MNLKNNAEGNSIKPTAFLLFWLAGLVFGGVILLLQPNSFYMDADYYYANGRNLASGAGLWENFLWNYLDSPLKLPHPAFTYWMPAASLISGLSMCILNNSSLVSARLPFVLLYAFVPPLTIFLSSRISKDPFEAYLAGGFALCCGYYLKLVTQVDTLAICMLAGSILFLLLAGEKSRFYISLPPVFRWLAVGGVAGLMHLSRADGFLWCGLVAFVILDRFLESQKLPGNWRWEDFWKKFLIPAGYSAGGYFLVTGFWYARNLQVFGSLVAPGSSTALWLTNYDELFTFHPENININHWLTSGWQAILSARAQALISNLTTAAAVEAMILFIPLAAVGLNAERNEPVIKTAARFWLVYLVILTVFFPFASSRGGFTHSTAAFQPLIWILSARGLSILITKISQKKKWILRIAKKTFGLELIIILAGITLIYGTDLSGILFPNQFIPYTSWKTYQKATEWMDQNGGEGSDVVMVNNPPAYYAATNRAAIVIPDGGINSTLAAADQFHARWMILDENHVSAFNALYNQPQTTEYFIYLGTIDGNQIYQIQ